MSRSILQQSSRVQRQQQFVIIHRLAYTATSSTAGATFAWTRAVVAGIANPIGSGATSSINESLDNTTTAPVVVRYVITPSYGACAGTPFNLDVTVNPTAVITSAATQDDM